jgi:sirohydrochlorin cobaltochelatase
MHKKGIVIIGHGSRKDEPNEALKQLVSDYQKQHQDLPINYGFIELAEPHMSIALDEMAKISKEIIALPMQLFHGNHIKVDIPKALANTRKKYADRIFKVADSLGTHPQIIDLAYTRTTETAVYASGNENEITVILVGRGSIEQDSIDQFNSVLLTFEEEYSFKKIIPAFIALAEPSLEESLHEALKEGHKKLVVTPYFLLSGVLMDRIHSIVNDFSSENKEVEIDIALPLGAHKKLFQVLDQRLNEACQID